MSIEKRKGLAAMAEVIAVLARYPGLRCSPVVDREDGVMALTIRVDEDGPNGLQVLALHDELKYVSDVAQVRCLTATYGITAKQLEPVLPPMSDDAPRGCLSIDEIEATIDAVQSLQENVPVEDTTMELLESALPKFVALSRALSGAV